jgi:hypothetical protein
MVTIQLYLLKSCMALSVLYVFYWLLLRNETDYRWNRFYLVFSIVISVFLPAVSINLKSFPGNILPGILQPVSINGFAQTNYLHHASNVFNILSIVYISGATFFCLRFLLGLFKIQFLYLRFRKFKNNGFITVLLDGNQSPFTFFNILFISRSDFKSGNYTEIIVHEKAHRDEVHSLDILLLEIITIIQWFNPFVWLFRLALKSLHEFIADRKVLLEGFDPVRYQKLLFEKSLGIAAFHLTNNFNYSLLKKRFKMMTINKSGVMAKMKYLLSMPLLLITVLALVIQMNSFSQTDNKVYTDVDVMAKYNGGDIQNVAQFLVQNLIYPESAKEKGVSARMLVQFVIDENGKVRDIEVVRTDILAENSREVRIKDYSPDKNPEVDQQVVKDFKNEALRVTRLLSGFTPAQKDGRNVKSQFTLPIEFAVK